MKWLHGGLVGIPSVSFHKAPFASTAAVVKLVGQFTLMKGCVCGGFFCVTLYGKWRVVRTPISSIAS